MTARYKHLLLIAVNCMRLIYKQQPADALAGIAQLLDAGVLKGMCIKKHPQSRAGSLNLVNQRADTPGSMLHAFQEEVQRHTEGSECNTASA